MAVQTSVAAAPAVAFAGMIADDGENDIITMKNADTVSMPFGIATAFKTSAPGSDLDAILPAASTAKLCGVVVHRHNYERTFTLPDGTVAGELDAVGIVAGITLSVMRRGRIWVQTKFACVPGDPLFISFSSTNVTYTAAGQLGNATDTNAIDATKVGQWLTTAAAGGIAKLECDFINKP